MTFEANILHQSDVLTHVSITCDNKILVTLQLGCNRLVIILTECLTLSLKSVHTKDDLIQMIARLMQDVKFIETYSIDYVTMYTGR